VVAVAVGAAGVIDERSGRVLSATDAIAGWPGTELASGLQRLLDLPVFADNDVNAHAAGEAWLGAGRGARTVLVVAVGTGVGGAVVIDGQPLHGVHHVAGEVGHVPARGAEHLTCGCGRRGHLEAVASGTGLLQHYRSLGGRDEVADSRAVLERAAAGDEVASRAVEDAATALGTSLAGMVMLVDPDVVVVGGGLAEAGDLWWEPVERTLRAELVDVAADVPLRRAVLGGTAPLVGAARNAWHRLGPSTEDAR
jgi:glucokinase